MKTIIFVFCTLLAFASIAKAQTSTSYTDVSESEWQTSDIEDSLNYGIQQILDIAFNASKISSTDYALSEINSVQEQTSDSETIYYKFNVVLTNSEETSTINATFVVCFESSTGDIALSSYSYKVTTSTATSTPLGDYVKLCNTQVKKNQNLTALLDWAMSCIYEDGVAAGKIPADNYTVINMTVWRQKLTTGYNYKVSAELHNDETISLSENFVVYSSTSGNKVLSSWSYSVSK